MDAFDRHVSPIVRRILCGCNESRALATLRDALLPRLISGKVHIRDAEATAVESGL
jgi:type I restriction enzyme S subunit